MKILDVTLRDGGFANDFRLPLASAHRIAALLGRAEVDAIEIGYLSGLPENHGSFGQPGPCFAWPLEDLSALIAQLRVPVVGMLHPSGPVALDYEALARTGLSLVRVPITPYGSQSWRVVVDHLRRAGIQFCLNLTLTSWCTDEQVLHYAMEAERLDANAFYLADTNSAYLPGRLFHLFQLLKHSVSVSLGYHAHDGKRLALANVQAAIQAGAEWIDSSLAGRRQCCDRGAARNGGPLALCEEPPSACTPFDLA